MQRKNNNEKNECKDRGAAVLTLEVCFPWRSGTRRGVHPVVRLSTGYQQGRALNIPGCAEQPQGITCKCQTTPGPCSCSPLTVLNTELWECCSPDLCSQPVLDKPALRSSRKSIQAAGPSQPGWAKPAP